MRWLRGISVGLVTGVVGMVLAFVAADFVTKAYHVSDMEGGRAMLVAFIFGPLGFLLGGAVGGVMTPFIRTNGFAAFASNRASHC